jgi:hypothetical protein
MSQAVCSVLFCIGPSPVARSPAPRATTRTTRRARRAAPAPAPPCVCVSVCGSAERAGAAGWGALKVCRAPLCLAADHPLLSHTTHVSGLAREFPISHRVASRACARVASGSRRVASGRASTQGPRRTGAHNSSNDAPVCVCACVCAGVRRAHHAGGACGALAGAFTVAACHRVAAADAGRRDARRSARRARAHTHIHTHTHTHTHTRCSRGPSACSSSIVSQAI